MRLIIALSVVVGVCACHRDRERPKSGPLTATAPAPTTPASAEMRSLAGRLAYEAANRPRAGSTVEAVVAAAAEAGVAIGGVRQYLGMTAAASYCAGGRTRDGLAVAVCEYPDAAAAIAGRAHVESTFATVPGRHIVVRGATTLTTTEPAGNDLSATRTAVERAFATL